MMLNGLVLWLPPMKLSPTATLYYILLHCRNTEARLVSLRLTYDTRYDIFVCIKIGDDNIGSSSRVGSDTNFLYTYERKK